MPSPYRVSVKNQAGGEPSFWIRVAASLARASGSFATISDTMVCKFMLPFPAKRIFVRLIGVSFAVPKQPFPIV